MLTNLQYGLAVTEDDYCPDNVAGYKWHRGVFFQATVVGITAFVAPGLWNAMNSVGAGGQQSPYVVMLVFHHITQLAF